MKRGPIIGNPKQNLKTLTEVEVFLWNFPKELFVERSKPYLWKSKSKSIPRLRSGTVNEIEDFQHKLKWLE